MTVRETSPNPRALDGFKRVILDPGRRWRSQPFDLKVDASWTHQPGSIVSTNLDEELFVKVVDRDAAHLSGMRFSTGSVWVSHALGEVVRVSFQTKSVSAAVVPFRVVYLPQDSPHGGFFQSAANPSETVLSFDFAMPEASEVGTHLVVVEPLEDQVEVVITKAQMEIVSE